VRSTKGTYIRKLAADVGDALGCGAHLSRLRRTACGDTRVEAALPLDEILKMDRAALTQRVIPMRLWAK
jgi:tRNA pseudouridine55 synthase